jgi:hypothetical protein
MFLSLETKLTKKNTVFYFKLNTFRMRQSENKKTFPNYLNLEMVLPNTIQIEWHYQ